MARPVDLAKRREIALKSLEILRDQGLQQATMSGLAKALGLKRPTLYFYFPSIPDLFLALVEIHREEEVGFVAERLAGKEHPIDMMLAFLRAEHAFVVEKGLDDFMLLMASFWASGGEIDRERFRQRVLRDLLPARELFTAMLLQGMAAGKVRECDAEGLVDVIFCLQDGVLVQGGVRDLDAEGVFQTFEALLAPLRIEPDATH